MTEFIGLATIFQPGAILQCGCPLPIWGWASPSQRIRFSLAGRVANGWVSRQGDFRVILPPVEAGGPHVLRAELPDNEEGIFFGIGRCVDR